jgi:hypothetical protein
MGETKRLVLETTGQERVIGALLRQLSIGLSAYRLFPGDQEQAGFAAAVQRIQRAAVTALEQGLVEAQVRGDHFVLSRGEILDDEVIARLAKACYERRAEWLRMTNVPTSGDLAVLYRVLTDPVEDVQASGGPAAMLRADAVTCLSLGEFAPQAVEVDEALGHRPVEPMTYAWRDLAQAVEVAHEETVGTSAMELGETLLMRLHRAVETVSPAGTPPVDLFRSLQTAVDNLPEEQRHLLTAMLLAKVGEDPLAQGFVGTLSDTELARKLVAVAMAEQVDPVRVAKRLVQRNVRGRELIGLTQVLAEGERDVLTAELRTRGDGVAAPPHGVAGDAETGVGGEGQDDQEEGRALYSTVSDLLGQSLLDHRHADVEALRDEFPESQDDEEAIATAAIHDYFRVEDDLHRLDQVLANWAGAAQRALRRGDREAVVRLVDVVGDARAEAESRSPERAAVFTDHWRQVPHPTILREVVTASRAAGNIDSMTALLAPLRDAAVEGLLETLAAEEHVHERALLLKLLGELAGDALDAVVKRLQHKRWEHVRDAVAVLQRVGGMRVTRLLEQATEHPIPDVRREAVKGLIAVGGAGAVPRLTELSLDPDEHVRSLAVDGLGGLVVPEASGALATVVARATDHSVRRTALDHLARNPSWAAGQALEQLAGKRSGAPRAVRRQARRAMRARKAGRR